MHVFKYNPLYNETEVALLLLHAVVRLFTEGNCTTWCNKEMPDGPITITMRNIERNSCRTWCNKEMPDGPITTTRNIERHSCRTWCNEQL